MIEISSSGNICFLHLRVAVEGVSGNFLVVEESHNIDNESKFSYLSLLLDS